MFLVLLIIGALTAIGFILATPKTVTCAWCPTYDCFGANSCGQGCVCMIPGGQTKGKCYSNSFKE